MIIIFLSWALTEEWPHLSCGFTVNGVVDGRQLIRYCMLVQTRGLLLPDPPNSVVA